jgi:hypothetical protein
MWKSLDMPVLFPTVLRLWAIPGQADLWLRVLGLLVGLGIVVVLWINARTMGYRFPFISLGLLAANVVLIRWGDSLRAYGIGALAIALAVGQIWSLMCQPTQRNFAMATVLAALSVHCLFQNAFLLGGICVAAILLCLLRKQPRTAVMVLGVGGLAAISLLVYYPLLTHAAPGWEILRSGFKGPVVLMMVSEALDSPPYVGPWVWLAIILACAGVGLAAFDRGSRDNRVTRMDLPLYAGACAGFGIAGYFLFLGLAKLPTQPWYYVPLMVYVAVCLDAGLAHWFIRNPRVWAIGAAVFCSLSLPFAINQARFRQTTIDVIADFLKTNAGPKDFIIVYPWYNGVTFDYYYNGVARWDTLPSLADHRGHRYDLLHEKLASEEPIKDMQERALEALAAGGNLWVVGSLPAPAEGETKPPTLSPAPAETTGWADEPYTFTWGRQMDFFLRGRGAQLEPVTIHLPTATNRYEAPLLFKVRSASPR